MDPLAKQHFHSAMGWVRFTVDQAITSENREEAEQIMNELNGQNIKLAQHFGFTIRTGTVKKVQLPPTTA